MANANDPETVEVMPEIRAQEQPIASSRKVTVRLGDNGPNATRSDIRISHGSKKDALSIQLNRTIRVPDNRDTNNLPPGLGTFPLFKVQDYAHNMPPDMAKKGGIFFPMYQREAMWVNFSAQAPFAIKIYVGGVNAVSGLPMTENEKTLEKRVRMLNSGKQIQDYMVVPDQNWLDGIVSEDGKIRQFVAQPKGSGFSVEAQVTGEENIGGIQIEVIPIKKNLPTQFDVRYENKQHKVVTRTFNVAEKGLTAESTWLDVKKRIRDEFDIAVDQQRLSDHGNRPGFDKYRIDFSDDTKLGDTYFPPNFSTISVVHDTPMRGRMRMMGGLKSMAAPGGPETMMYECATASVSSAMAAPPPEVEEMGLAAGGLITQTIEADKYPADVWDVEASVMMNLQILGVESFCAVTGQPAPDTPVNAQSYANHGYPFFEIWGEEKTGIKGDFSEVKSVAQLEAERAEAAGEEYKEEESVPLRIVQLGPFRSTFRPVEVLKKELEGLRLE
ncbi:integral membrane protein [Colletotrichum salicis]|uniref:Integral membrane protein n=1 Tax=Colletotrichum salicis TaxID=1209931 RepID=A0A135UTJ5_9PEZI|nr:integral membrane protein [Colletotrichum salicis]